MMHWTISAVHTDHVLLPVMVGRSWRKRKLEQRFWPVERFLHGPLRQAESGGTSGIFRPWCTLECGKRQFSTNFFFSLSCTKSKSLPMFARWGKWDMEKSRMLSSTTNSAIKVWEIPFLTTKNLVLLHLHISWQLDYMCFPTLSPPFRSDFIHIHDR